MLKLTSTIYPRNIALFAILFSGLVGLSGCSSSNETSVITPSENFQEEADVAEAKAKAMAESQKEPL
jgi:hypothetical protein